MNIKNEVNGYFIKGLFGCRSEKVGVQKIRKGQKSGMIEKVQFSLICVWLGGEKVERWKKMKNEVGINLQLYPYLIKQKATQFFIHLFI